MKLSDGERAGQERVGGLGGGEEVGGRGGSEPKWRSQQRKWACRTRREECSLRVFERKGKAVGGLLCKATDR